MPVAQHLGYLPTVLEVVILKVMPVALVRPEADTGCALVRSDVCVACWSRW